MSSRIDSTSAAAQRQVYRYRGQANFSAVPARTATTKTRTVKKVPEVSEGVKAAAKAVLGGANNLKKISDSRKLSKPVDELTGIKDINAHYYVHQGANRRVVQLRDAKTSELVRQVPNQAALERLTTMRRFAGRFLDIVI